MRIVQFTDLHLFADPTADLYGAVPETNFHKVWQRIQQLDPLPERLFITGDLTHDDSAVAYSRIHDAVNEFGVPTYWIPGNHDDRQVMAQQLRGCLASDRCADLGAWRLVLLDSQLTGEIPGELAADQLTFLETSLARCAAGGSPTLIALHHPPFRLGSKWIDDYRLQNETAFWGIVDKYDCVRGVVCGHVHQTSDSHRNGVRLLTTPATAVQFSAGTDEPEVDVTAPSGFRVFDLDDDGGWRTEVVTV
ncbi:MAG: phosphodiesterase [Planctomycetota bacterium]